MATITFQSDLTGQTDGKQIKVVQTATPGDTIHAAQGIDIVDIFAVNSSSAAVKLTIEWGEATAPDGNIELTIPPESGLVQVTDRMVIANSLVVKAFASVTDVIMLSGRYWSAA